MNAVDDPLFDPWCLSDPAEEQGPAPIETDDAAADPAPERPDPGEHASVGPEPPAPEPRALDDATNRARWRSPAGQGVPITRRPPSAKGPPPESEPERPWEIDEVVPFVGWGGDPLPEASDVDPGSRPRSVPERIREVVIPRLERASRRLVLARHRITLDDRLDEEHGSLRFRIEPWKAPFDPPRTAAAPVVEVVPDGADVVGRIWLDPTGDEPTSSGSTPLEGLSGSWVDALLLKFVEQALARDQ